jgi:hypothetical protein
MTKNPFDQFSKQLFEAFLAPLGEVRINYEVPGEPRFIDILFAPFPQPHTNPEELGLLSRIASVPCLLEPYRNQPNLPEIRSCLQKLFFVQSNFQREANREDQRLDEEQLPRQWIITPTVSDRILNNFGGNLRSDWLDGIYFFVEGLKTAIIAVNSLPPTPETLLFRILGRGKVQRQALSEILALPRDDNRRSTTLRLLSTWKITIEITQEVDNEDEELIMIVSQAYQEWEQETKRQGIEQGQSISIENLLKARFGEDQQLAQIIPLVLILPIEEYTPLLLQLSREELLARFQTPNK